MAFHNRLKEARIKSGLTQDQLAEKLGIAKSTLSGYEGGNREPAISTIAKMLDILNIDANYLYQDELVVSAQISYEDFTRNKKYHDLDEHGKEMVDFVLDREHKRSISEMDKVVSIEDARAEYMAPVAACPDETATDEEREADDNMMKDDSEWGSD